jgi:hypothetical protein
MIQINCTIENITSAPILSIEDGHSYIAELESSTRAIFKLNDSEKNKLGNFLADGQLVFKNYIIPGQAGAYEGPILILKPSVEELRIFEDQFLLPSGENYNWKGNIDYTFADREWHHRQQRDGDDDRPDHRARRAPDARRARRRKLVCHSICRDERG